MIVLRSGDFPRARSGLLLPRVRREACNWSLRKIWRQRSIWSAPTLDLKANALCATTGDSYSHPAQAASDAFVAFDLATGKLKWSRQMTASDAYNIACVAPYRSNCPEPTGPDLILAVC